MHKGPLDDQCFNGIQFDVIVWVEVIEHINHPHRDLAVINRLLRPGGLLFVTTPNFNSIERRWLGEKFNVIDWPEHLTYYTPKTLRRVLASEEFSKKKITTTGISFSRLKSSLGQQAAPTSAAASADESFRSAAERNFLLKYVKWQINVFLNLTRTGLSMKGWFEKKS
ncbi:MAG: class I SAM-dependent methyltransferase [Flavobacteriales bacterium]|nr:class I SAM-dependent methyltransferase [Flavobacteriales bacterium]